MQPDIETTIFEDFGALTSQLEQQCFPLSMNDGDGDDVSNSIHLFWEENETSE